MKTSIRTTLTALAITAIVTGPAAANITGQSISGAVQSSITEGNVNVTVNSGVATLFGWTDSKITANAAKQAALSFDNVDTVVDLITLSN